MGCVYIMTEGTATRPIKVGVANNPLGRLSELQTGNPRKLRLARSWNTWTRDHAFRLERAILEQFANSRLRGEWLDTTEQEVADFIVATDDEDVS